MKIDPLITVGMPVKDRRWCIEMVLDAVYNVDYPKKRMRLVFVDSSTDGTYEFLKKWVAKHGREYEKILVVKAPPEGIPKARNVCLSHFKGDFFLSMDSDVIATPDSIRKLLKHFEDPKVGIAALPYYTKAKGDIFRKAWQEWMRTEASQNVAMGFALVRSAVIREVGKFDVETAGYEDDDYCCRTLERGYRVALDTGVFLEHLHPEYKGLSFTQELKLNFRKARSRARLFLIHRPSHMIRRFLFYSAFLVSIPLMVVNPIPFLALFVVALIYHGVIKGKGWGRIINPFLITLLGIIWTVGTLVGLIERLWRRR